MRKTRPDHFAKYISPVLIRKEKMQIKNLYNNVLCRNLLGIRKVMNYVDNHGVYISLTTSPDRIRKSAAVLAMVDNPLVTGIFVVLPDKYRNQQSYRSNDIDFIQSFSSKITVLREKTDLGPVLKMLPALERMQDPDAIVIALDDDIAYPASLIYEFVYHAVCKPDLVWAGSGIRFGEFPFSNYKRSLWPQRKPKPPNLDMVEGWGGVAYKKRLVDLAVLRKMSGLSLKCGVSDDLVISFMLARKRITRRQIDNEYYRQSMLVPMQFGLGEDALHYNYGNEPGDINYKKYVACLDDLQTIKNR